jgi:hypothetical protein
VTLSEIASGVETVTEQQERGVVTVDSTDDSLAERLAVGAEALPCTPEAAAVVVESHARGVSVGESAREAGIAPVTAAKALHRCGVVGVSPVGPTARDVIRDWLSGSLPRSDARELVGCDGATFALAAYVESHDSVPELADAAADALGSDGEAGVEKRDRLAETMSSVSELR